MIGQHDHRSKRWLSIHEAFDEKIGPLGLVMRGQSIQRVKAPQAEPAETETPKAEDVPQS